MGAKEMRDSFVFIVQCAVVIGKCHAEVNTVSMSANFLVVNS